MNVATIAESKVSLEAEQGRYPACFEQDDGRGSKGVSGGDGAEVLWRECSASRGCLRMESAGREAWSA